MFCKRHGIESILSGVGDTVSELDVLFSSILSLGVHHNVQRTCSCVSQMGAKIERTMHVLGGVRTGLAMFSAAFKGIDTCIVVVISSEMSVLKELHPLSSSCPYVFGMM